MRWEGEEKIEIILKTSQEVNIHNYTWLSKL